MTLYPTKRLISSTLLALLAVMTVAANVEIDPRSRVSAQAVCSWAQDGDALVIPGTLSNRQQDALDKLLDKLEDAAGGAIPEIGAVKKAINELGPGEDVVDVVAVYKCIDNTGTVHRQRRTLDNTENVLWAAKMDQAKGEPARERDRQRERAINKHRPTTSCCPPEQPSKPPPGKEPCQPPPPCKECTQLYVAIVIACERIDEIGREQDNLGTQLRAAKGENDPKKINDLKADSARRRVEQARLEARIKDLKSKLNACEKEHCGKTATANPPVRGFDACLIGTWRSVQATSPFGHWTNGGEGVILTIAGDGQAAIDYGRMQPNVVGETTRTWGGSATGKLTSSNNTLTVKGATFNVTITFTGPGQSGVPSPMRGRNGLGNLLQEVNETGAQTVYRYTCDATTLAITGIPWSSTFKRLGTLP